MSSLESILVFLNLYVQVWDDEDLMMISSILVFLNLYVQVWEDEDFMMFQSSQVTFLII